MVEEFESHRTAERERKYDMEERRYGVRGDFDYETLIIVLRCSASSSEKSIREQVKPAAISLFYQTLETKK